MFLYANKDNIHIIDLEQTFFLFRRALNFVQQVYEKQGYILYVPTATETPSQSRKNALNDNTSMAHLIKLSLAPSELPRSYRNLNLGTSQFGNSSPLC